MHHIQVRLRLPSLDRYTLQSFVIIYVDDVPVRQFA